jgi:putative transposase
MSDPKREDVIRRIRGLPSDQLRAVENLLEKLEGGGTLQSRSIEDQASTSADQRLAASIAAVTPSAPAVPQTEGWPHAPVHRISEAGTYIVTAGTYQKEHHFGGARRLNLLESTLRRTAEESGWQIEAWAVFSNHYHFVAHSRRESEKLNILLKQLHAETACEVNRLDGVSERQVWHNYWDTRLTFEKSYLARLNYVHQNPVKHGLVPVVNQYRWCSAAWFERTATPAQVKTIYRFKIDEVRVRDDFEPI